MNSAINLHWNNEVCIADGLHEDKKQEYSELWLETAQTEKETAKPHTHILFQKGRQVKQSCKVPQANDKGSKHNVAPSVPALCISVLNKDQQ